MKKPIIGIVGKIMDKTLIESEFFGWSIIDISNDINYALIKNGAAAIGILPPKYQNVYTTYKDMDDIQLSKSDMDNLHQVLALCDGIILEGGITAYSYEKYIAQYALEHDIPFLAICSGMNITVLANGGSLKKTTNPHFFPTTKQAHPLNIEKDSKLFQIIKKEKIMVNSVHGNTPDNITGLDIAARAHDGIVEAVERKDKRFYLGVAFHPEMLVDDNEDMNLIFTEFVKASAK